MPDETKSAQTVRELGIELAGFKEVTNLKLDTVNKNLEVSSEHIESLTTAIQNMMSGKVDQKDFDAHVLWGETQVTLLAGRVKILEDEMQTRKNSIGTKIKKAVEDNAVRIVGIVLVATFAFTFIQLAQPGVFNLFK